LKEAGWLVWLPNTELPEVDAKLVAAPMFPVVLEPKIDVERPAAFVLPVAAPNVAPCWKTNGCALAEDVANELPSADVEPNVGCPAATRVGDIAAD